MGDKLKGFYNKFQVWRIDQTDLVPTDKHYACMYFVLDLTHDKHAIPALEAYTESAKADGYDLLAEDLQEIINQAKNE